MPLENIVDVQISRQTTAVSRAGFGELLIVGPNATFPERYRKYNASELSTLAGDLTGGTAAAEYRAASTLVSQSPRVSQFSIGREALADADMTATLNAIFNESQDFYGVMDVDRTKAKSLLAAAWCLANKKIFGVADDDSAIITTGDVTSIPYTLKSLGNYRAFCLYSAQADGGASDPFPEAAIFGQWMPQTPGSYTVMFKTLTGVTPDVLTGAQQGFALGKQCNIYHEVGGVQIVDGGFVSDSTPEYIDTIVGIDWLQARMTERIYSKLVNVAKIPFTDAGIDIVAAEVKAQLQDGIDAGLLAADPAPVVTVPLAADVDLTDKANRLLPDINFTATLAGAIHVIQVRGVVTL